jgi:hypothetical protein
VKFSLRRLDSKTLARVLVKWLSKCATSILKAMIESPIKQNSKNIGNHGLFSLGFDQACSLDAIGLIWLVAS